MLPALHTAPELPPHIDYEIASFFHQFFDGVFSFCVLEVADVHGDEGAEEFLKGLFATVGTVGVGVHISNKRDEIRDDRGVSNSSIEPG